MSTFFVKLNSNALHARAINFMIAAFIFGVASFAVAQSRGNKPVKMKIEAQGKNFRSEEPVEFQVTCLDADNNNAEVKQDYTITVLTHLPSGKVDTASVTIPAGAAAQKMAMTFQESGIIHVQAQHDRLLQGETFIQVKPKSRARAEAQQERRNGAAQENETFSRSVREQISLQSAGSYTLTLRYSPQRTLLADGKDQATIQAFVLSNDDSNANEIRVRLFSNGGALSPQPIIIPAGQDVGMATLTSKDPQTVTVEYVNAAPPANLQGENSMQIVFGPPISQLGVDASPPVITLVDKSDLVVKLLDSSNTPVATDVARKVSFTIEAGRGDIETKELTIAAGSFEARTSFRPTWRGDVRIIAATPNLQTAPVEVKVTLPILVLSLSILGAAIGGLIAYWREQEPKWWRIVLGLVTGFVFYWAFVFGVLPLISREIVLNPLSALALSVIGGWLGTEVFNMVLKRLGLISKAGAAS